MTAEIAIMNKEAIALAADSAVTMGQEGGEKIFPSANKLFALSKYHPVGIMVYGNAALMEVPWEVVIKIYRQKLGRKQFGTVDEFADNFIRFLDGRNRLFPQRQQKEYLYANTLSYFNYQIREDIVKRIKSVIRDAGKVTQSQVKQISLEVIGQHYRKWRAAKLLPTIPKTHISQIVKRHGPIIDKAIDAVLEKLPLSRAARVQLRKIAASLFSKDIFPEDVSGVVVAGFGRQEAFPSLKSFITQGIVNNKLKYKAQVSAQIDFENVAAIVPFAQREMVYTFMEGIDPRLLEYTYTHLLRLFEKYPEIIVENLKKLDDKQKRRILKGLQGVSARIFGDYRGLLDGYRKAMHVEPVTKVVAGLPKNELAAMAESLVSLTSFKKRVTFESETVAHPIDVAVISKGDGFVWIKRKRYFEPDLNPQFFANYYREEGNDKK